MLFCSNPAVVKGKLCDDIDREDFLTRPWRTDWIRCTIKYHNIFKKAFILTIWPVRRTSTKEWAQYCLGFPSFSSCTFIEAAMAFAPEKHRDPICNDITWSEQVIWSVPKINRAYIEDKSANLQTVARQLLNTASESQRKSRSQGERCPRR